ncbi:MAG: helix-turn-helix domain-containing protein [Eggerthellaceae bacterium]|nr:helix-turn-helix domain-containing protein [Eggerthellaceae bacterium]
MAPLEIQWVGIASPRFASHAGFLYFVTDESEVPSLPLNPSDMFGCVVPESIAEQCRGIPRIIVSDECDLDALFAMLVTEIERYRDWHDRISDLLVTDAPYQVLVNETAEFVPRPMYIADASWRMIARVDFEMNEISATWHYQMLHDGLYPHHIVDALNRTGDYFRISNLPHASLIDSEVYTLRILAKPIRHQGRLVGYYFMIDTWGDLGFCEVEIAEEFGTMLAPLMAARDAQQGYIAGFQDNFIFHILDGLLTNKHDIARQLMSERHWNVESDFRLATVRFEPNEFENHLLHMRTMGMLLGNFESHAYSYRDTAIAIFHRVEDAQDDFDQHVQRCCQSLKRVIVVSNRFRDFSQLKTYYEQNIYVHESIEAAMDLEPRVISCDSTFPRLLAERCRGELPGCYEADVLRSYDTLHNTTYCKTLFTYLKYERNAVATADALFIHRNTLRNHLNKIAEITNSDFDDADVRFHLLISLNTLLNAGRQ